MIESALTEMVEASGAEGASDLGPAGVRQGCYFLPDGGQAGQGRGAAADIAGFRCAVLGKRSEREADSISLQQHIRGFHLRAARALLDWPMPTLAECSALSLSTVKRLEDDRDSHATRSRRKAIAALDRAGIRFLALADGTIAVAKRRGEDAPDDPPENAFGGPPDDASGDVPRDAEPVRAVPGA